MFCVLLRIARNYSNSSIRMAFTIGDKIGTIFQNRFPNAALHSVELNSNDLNYGYKVVGYSKYHQYKMKIDVITGNTSDMDEGGKPKKVIGEIFNKDKVIEAAHKTNIIWDNTIDMGR